jgi:SAM-dependent MidA family methyltransferase
MIERLDHFMRRANAAYYATHNPYADFTTAPEISQVFGEIVGLWAAVAWQSLGSPTPVILAEAGPGRGTLMEDALRAISRVAPAFRTALHLHLVETSPSLRAHQASRLPEATWHDSVADLPPGPLILIANEFLDALPIRQFIRRHSGWMERWVKCSRFVEIASDYDSEHNLPAPEGTVIEISQEADMLAQFVGEKLFHEGGCALFFDYGDEYNRRKDTLQAIKEGTPASPLSPAGSADLTAHVDFASFARAARSAGAAVHGPLDQGEFLTRLGLFHRTERLARGQPPPRAAALLDAARRLAEPARMGRLFKALALTQQGAPTPPGFDP